MADDLFNLTDIRKKPTGKDGIEIATGFLVVRAGTLTEKEFERLYGGDTSKLPPDKIIFEDAEGNVETSSPRGGTDR